MNLFNESTKKVAEILKALGHPARIEILRLLIQKKSNKIPVKQIHESLGLTQAETSRHLIVLKNASVLNCGKEGPNSFYFISNNPVVQNIVVCLEEKPTEIK
jgi:ArsR family transcriptional regulator, arsenate/arsenite/antimonite-responsive transcriptional repressor